MALSGPVMQSYFTVLLVFAISGCGGAPSTASTAADEATPPRARVAAALAGEHRTDEERARDRLRHPEETLDFFGLRPDMTVVEMSPGAAGWYTKVLTPVLRDEGRLIAAIGDPSSDAPGARYAQGFLELLRAHPDVLGRVETVTFEPPDRLELGPEGSADMVLTFRSVHGWVNRAQAEAVFAAMARVLRPGGVLGVVQHRAPEGADVASSSQNGYVPEAHVIALAQGAGLRLDARSDINANPADTHDHPEGVWSLPPTLRGGDDDRERFLAIGESDRMTLRFVRPAVE